VTDHTFAGGPIEDVTGCRQLAVGDEEAVTVFVVDDSPVFRRGMTRAVEVHAELELVGEADSGAAALEAIAQFEPDVVLLDLRMPDLDGFGVLERLRALDPQPATRVVIVSASLDDDVEDSARAAGAAACIGKEHARADICAAVVRLARQ
jgi:two-component system nitrate/nitrite response regulator NarL